MVFDIRFLGISSTTPLNTRGSCLRQNYTVRDALDHPSTKMPTVFSSNGCEQWTIFTHSAVNLMKSRRKRPPPYLDFSNELSSRSVCK
jgi:hypothetical protein